MENISCCLIGIVIEYLSLKKLLQILQLVSGQNDMLINNTIKEENINDTQKVWMDIDQEKQLASILDETKGWKKLAHYFDYKYLMNIFKQTSSSSLLLLNYIAVRFSFSRQIFYALLCNFSNIHSH